MSTSHDFVGANPAWMPERLGEGRQALLREVEVDIAEGDGRTLVSRLVPYNQVATVDDGTGAYREMFVPGAFNAQMRAANRIQAFLNFRHSQSFRDVIGHAKAIFDRGDGLHGELRVVDGPDGDKALALLAAGVLNKLSIEFVPMKSRVVNGVTERLSARLLGVALVPQGAYADAAVLAVREDDAEFIVERLGVGVANPPLVTADESLRPVPFDPVFAAQLARYVDLPLDLRMLNRAFTDQPWDGASSRWPDADSYCRSCLIDDNTPGQPKTKALCHLPVREVNGDVNVHAVQAALARVDQVQTSDANKAAARRKLEAMMNDAQAMMA